MRTAIAVVVLLVCVQASEAQRAKPPLRPADDETLAVGTIDKVDDKSMTVNRLKGGEPLTFTYTKDCTFRKDGLTVKVSEIKRGMKVICQGNSATKQLLVVQAFDKDPLPR